MSALGNPYSGKTFGGVLMELFHRLFLFFWGRLSLEDLVSDEIQLCVLIFIALSAAWIGTFLVLKRATMLANSLSHTILFGIVLAFLLMQALLGKSEKNLHMSLPILFLASLLTGILTAFFTELVHKKMLLQEDASIGLVFILFFVLGITLITLFTRNTHISVEAVMGNVDGLHLHDVKLTFVLALGNFFLLLLFFKRWEIVIFDPTLARSFGISTFFFNHLLMIQTAATAIGAFRAVGLFLFLAFLVGPTLIARFFACSLKKILFFSSLVGVVISCFSVALSRHIFSMYGLPLSTAGLCSVSIAILLFLCYFLKSGTRCLGKLTGRFFKKIPF